MHVLGSAVIASGGTTSAALEVPGGGYELCAVNIPTLDSATVTFQVSHDGGTTYRAIHSNAAGAASAILTLGTADTGAKATAVPDTIRFATVGASHIKVVAGAAQNGGARTIVCVFRKVPG